MNLAILVSTSRLLRSAGFETTNQAAIVFECARAEDEGKPHTLSSLTDALEMPFSTASRVAWEMHEAGWLRYEQHPTDRRMKFVLAERKKLRKVFAMGTAG